MVDEVGGVVDIESEYTTTVVKSIGDARERGAAGMPIVRVGWSVHAAIVLL